MNPKLNKCKNIMEKVPIDELLIAQLFEDFTHSLHYYPTVNNIPNIRLEVKSLISTGTKRMYMEGRTSAKDIEDAKEAVALLRVGMSCQFQKDQQISATDLIEQTKIEFDSLWPFF